jgi:hypothetical protein
MSIFVGIVDAIKDKGCFKKDGPDFNQCKKCEFYVKEIGSCFFDISSGIAESLVDFSGRYHTENCKKEWGLTDFFMTASADDLIIIKKPKCLSLHKDILAKLSKLSNLKKQPQPFYDIHHIKYLERSLMSFSAVLKKAIKIKRGIEAG